MSARPQSAATIQSTTFIQNALLVLGASLLLALSAKIAVQLPFAAAPLTLQPLALLLIGGALGWRRGAAAATVYLVEGALGLPVFANGGGAQMFIGPTAGFLFSFPAAAAIAGASAERFSMRLVLMLAAIGALYLGGWSWIAGPLQFGAAKAFAVGVAPFVAADVCKAVIAALVLTAARRRG